MKDAMLPASVMPSSRIWPFCDFLVIHEHVAIDGLIELAAGGVNAALAEHGFHAEGAGFVGNDGHNVFADFRLLEQPL